MTLLVAINAAVSLLAAAGLFASAYGWRYSLTREADDAERFFAGAKVLYALAIGSHLVFWAGMWALWVSPEGPPAISPAALISVNILTGGLVLLGAYCSLQARWLLIPEGERENWRWWNGWMHPSGWRRRKL